MTVTENEYRKSHNPERLLEAQSILNISGLLSKCYFIIYSPQCWVWPKNHLGHKENFAKVLVFIKIRITAVFAL